MEAVVGSLLVTLATEIAKEAGVTVFKEMLGAEKMDLTDLSIQRIVDGVASAVAADLRSQLFQQTISRAQSRLGGIRNFLVYTYPHLGGSAAGRDHELSDWARDLCLEVLGPLASEDLGQDARLACLPAWMVAAAVHMAILQERVNLMPREPGRQQILRTHAQKYAAVEVPGVASLTSERLP